MGRWTAALSFLSGAVEPVAARLRPHAEVLARRWRTVAGGAAGAVVLASLACVASLAKPLRDHHASLQTFGRSPQEGI